MARKRVANEGDCSSSSARTGSSRLESSDTASSGNSQNAAAETLFQDCVDDFVEARSHSFSQRDPSGQVSKAVEVHPFPARCMLEDNNHTTLCATRNTTRAQGNHRTAFVNREKTAQSGSFSINSHAMEVEDSEIMMKPRSQIFHFRNKFGEERNQSVRI
uniref:Testis expressed 15, meiosis and synapsis associated n=1 Tax=Haemonchus contortus TaxID=6289 RepID=A0A7I4YWC7_HAECO